MLHNIIMSSFVWYPDIEDKNFYDATFTKKEFNKTLTGPEYQSRDPREACSAGEFKLQNHQEFVRNFVSPETPYNGVLMFAGTGVGKTCAAMSITEGMRDYVHKLEKKIYVISSEIIRQNFYRELYDDRRAKREKDMHSPPGSYQCAGNTYYFNDPNPARRKRKAEEMIKEYYEFYGPMEFANYVDIKLSKQQGKTESDIADLFSNSIFVIDEAHGIAGKGKLERRKKKKDETKVVIEHGSESESEAESKSAEEIEEGEEIVPKIIRKKKKADITDRTLLAVMLDIINICRKYGSNIKLVLLTATPMKDNQSELADLLQLLNANDGKEIDRKRLFPSDERFDRDYLAQIARGYISFVRGNNPITFPRPMLPPADSLYNPSPMFSYDDADEIIQNSYTIFLDEEKTVSYKYNLVKCPMSLFQFSSYIAFKANISDHADNSGRQVSNIVYPTPPTNMTTMQLKRTFGNQGFKNNFTEITTALANDTMVDGKKLRAKKHTSYEYNENVLRNYGMFLMQDNPEPDKKYYNLAYCSNKYSKVIENIIQSPGIAYAYSEFDTSGALTIALALEANGFIRFHPGLRFRADTGLPMDLNKLPQARLLSYTSTANAKAYATYLKDNFRCAECGKLYLQCRELNQELPSSQQHKFVQATYIIYTGTIGNVESIEHMRDEANMHGHKVKAIIGTTITGQGVDFKWVRQVHIVDPWHNNTRIYQAIGRGIRFCSHVDLAPDERNVTVFKYCSTVPVFTDSPLVISDEAIETEDPRTLSEDMTEILDEQVIISDEGEMVELEFTYRDLLTETMDEKMYNRVVNKDIYIKRIERVLKEVAVDCALNRYINYYGDNDEDYSRECDYDVCNYSCTGFQTPPKFLDLSIIRPMDESEPVLIRSKHYFSDGVWREMNDENDEIDREILDQIRNDGRLTGWDMDFDITDDMDVIANEIFDALLSVVKKKQTTPRGEEIHFEKYLGNVDTSTYNVHFAQPQINTARMYISRLFQHNVALKEKDIIDLVSRIDPLLDVEFIRSALDQMVGNPPYVAPKEIRDKFNRSGHIIFVGKYYVFQPFDMEDTTIPAYYRVNPLKIKRHHFNIDSLASTTEIAEETNYKLDQAAMDTFINDVLMPLATEAAEGDEVSALLKIIRIRMLLDKRVLLDQKYVIQRVLTLAVNGDDEVLNVLARIIEKYYEDQHLLFEFEDQKFLLINEPSSDSVSIFNPTTGLWKVADASDESLSEFRADVSKIYTSHINFTGKEVFNGIFGFLAPTNVTRVKTLLGETSAVPITVELVKRAVNDFTSYIKIHSNTSNLQFKLVNTKTEVIQHTKGGSKSAKTLPTGIVCLTKNRKTISDTVDILMDVFNESYISYHNPAVNDFVEIDGNELMALVDSSGKGGMCDKLEFILRVLDYIRFDDKKWFLSPFEIEFYRPMTKAAVKTIAAKKD